MQEFVVDGCNMGFMAGQALSGAARRRFCADGLTAVYSLFERKKLRVTIYLKRSFFNSPAKQRAEGMTEGEAWIKAARSESEQGRCCSLCAYLFCICMRQASQAHVPLQPTTSQF